MAIEWSVPVIDLTPWVGEGTAEERTAVASAVDEANRTVGFLQIVGHGVPDEAVNGLCEAMDALYGLPMEERLSLAAPPHVNRGYTPPNRESLSRTIGIEQPGANDYFEAFNIGTTFADFPALALPESAYPENIWPSLPDFSRKIDAYRAEAARVARVLTAIYADALGLPPRFFSPFTDHSIEMLRMVNYALAEGAPAPLPDQRGMGEHTDFGIVTVLWADPVPGLQVLGTDGTWHEVLPMPGALLVNLGDLMARWTNDRWLSTLHRVIPPVVDGAIVRRRSAAFFHDGNVDAVIETIASCRAADGSSYYDPIDIGTHIAAKIASGRTGIVNGQATREAQRVRAAAG